MKKKSKKISKEVLALLKNAEADSYGGLSIESISEVLGFEKEATEDLQFALSYLKEQDYVDINESNNSFTITLKGSEKLKTEEE